jgi:peroxiredoxin
MTKTTLMIGLCLLTSLVLTGFITQHIPQESPVTIKPGDIAPPFTLKNVDGSFHSLNDYLAKQEGVILVFTCNHCPYANKYDDRLIALQRKFAPKGFPVIAINPNDADKYPTDSYDSMVYFAREKKYNFPYLHDETQETAKAYGALKTPHIYLLHKKKGAFYVAYIGAIDDNYKDAKEVKITYVADAIEALIKGVDIEKKETKAVGCSIKWKN